MNSIAGIMNMLEFLAGLHGLTYPGLVEGLAFSFQFSWCRDFPRVGDDNALEARPDCMGSSDHLEHLSLGFYDTGTPAQDSQASMSLI